jgi:hypothetical protein
MSHKAKIICDRCGKDRLLPSSASGWQTWGNGDRSLDFCPKCVEQFKSFLMGQAVVACLAKAGG